MRADFMSGLCGLLNIYIPIKPSILNPKVRANKHINESSRLRGYLNSNHSSGAQGKRIHRSDFL